MTRLLNWLRKCFAPAASPAASSPPPESKILLLEVAWLKVKEEELKAREAEAKPLLAPFDVPARYASLF